MDRCGEYLQVASLLAKRQYGRRATVCVDESPPSFPDDHRWTARAKVDREVVETRSGVSPELAARRLAESLTSVVGLVAAEDRAMLDSASRLGLG